jgi:hypothetical protein
MKIPTIHSNGDSSGALYAMYNAAQQDLDIAITRLSYTYPNGRNFYPQGDGALAQACAEHDIRMMKLRKIREEILYIMEAILDGRTE